MIKREEQLDVIQAVDRTITQMNVEYEFLATNYEHCLALCHELAAALIPVRLAPVESTTSGEWLAQADAAIKKYNRIDGATLPAEDLFRRGQDLLQQIISE